jgi:hypothetical protein
MNTPFFPAFRGRLAALGARTLSSLRQATLVQLGQHLRGVIPLHLTASEEGGDNSRERTYTLRLTFECFIWQVLNPGSACREVVRQVQSLCRLCGRAVNGSVLDIDILPAISACFAPAIEEMLHITRRPHLQSLCDPFHRHHRLCSQPRRQRHLPGVPDLLPASVPRNRCRSSSSRKIGSRRSPRLSTS